MKYLMGFLAGFILPAIVSPFLIAYFAYSQPEAIPQLPLLFFGSFFWGIWNVIFLATRKYVAVTSRNYKIGFYGAFYGLVSALINSFYFEFTSVIPAIPDAFMFAYIIVYPVILFFVWMIVVNTLNLLFDTY